MFLFMVWYVGDMDFWCWLWGVEARGSVGVHGRRLGCWERLTNSRGLQGWRCVCGAFNSRMDGCLEEHKRMRVGYLEN